MYLLINSTMSKYVAIFMVIFLCCCIDQVPSSPGQSVLFRDENRSVISLDGGWEFLPVYEDSLKISQTRFGDWQKITVPHHFFNREGLHRAWYRCTFSGIEAPQVRLAFDGVFFACEIYLNGHHVGDHRGGYLPFEIDITDHLQDTNELVVGVEDVSAALKDNSFPPDMFDAPPDSLHYPIGSAGALGGIWQSVFLKSYPTVHVEDVFVTTSYRRNEITVEITVQNSSTAEMGVVIANGIPDTVQFAEKEVFLSPLETKTFTFTEEWKDPILWSPETPLLYHLETVLSSDGQVVDTKQTRFGFREFWIEESTFYLNGIPISLRGTSKHLLGDPWTGDHEADAQLTLSRVTELKANVLRLHANPHPEIYLDRADEIGLLIIDESALWCFSHQYDLRSDSFWEHAQDHIRSLVIRDRNHPSLVIWSVENEILLCGGDRVERTSKELVKLGEMIKELDPTRPIMYEGDIDPGNADIINLHYPHEYPQYTQFPHEAYFLESTSAIDFSTPTNFSWDRSKPLYIGEFSWIPIMSPHPHTIFYGDQAFTDHHLYRQKAKGEAWKTYVEAFRSQRVNGMCPWNPLEGGAFPTPLSEAVKAVYPPFFSFIKEYSTHFFSGESVQRTIVLCNDTITRQEIAVQVKWNHEIEEQTCVLDPGERTELLFTFTAPLVDERTHHDFTVEVTHNGTVENLKKGCEVFPQQDISLDVTIGLYDLVGETQALFDHCGIEYDLLSSPHSSSHDLVVIGYHALTEPDIPTVGQFSSGSGTILCFEQNTLAPFGLTLTDHGSTMAFQRTPSLNLSESDLRFWGDDDRVSQRDITKPVRGTYYSLVDSGGVGGLEYTSLLQFNSPEQQVIFCQMLVTEKFYTEPMAQVVFSRLLEYAVDLSWSPQTLGLIGMSEFCEILNPVHEVCVNESDCDRVDVLLIEDWDRRPAWADGSFLKGFAEQGGTVWLRGLDPQEIEDIIDISWEKMTVNLLPVLLREDTLTRGLSHQEFYWTEPAQRWYIPLSLDIAPYYVTETDAVTPLTDPGIISVFSYGKGQFLIDFLNWKSNMRLSSRIGSALLANLGIEIERSGMMVQAESMDIVQVTLGEATDSWYAFYTNGYIGKKIHFPTSGRYTVRIYAYAHVVEDRGAILQLLMDRTVVDTMEITEQRIYELDITVSEGVHEIGIAFTNDFYEPPHDRNLYVDYLEIFFTGNDLSVWYVT